MIAMRSEPGKDLGIPSINRAPYLVYKMPKYPQLKKYRKIEKINSQYVGAQNYSDRAYIISASTRTRLRGELCPLAVAASNFRIVISTIVEQATRPMAVSRQVSDMYEVACSHIPTHGATRPAHPYLDQLRHLELTDRSTRTQRSSTVMRRSRPRGVTHTTASR